MTESDRVESTEDARPPLTVGGRIKRRMVLAWALWDWGSSAYSAVITSFVFGPYIVRGVVGDAQPGGLTANTWLGIANAAAGFLVAAIAPVTGQRADAGGHRSAAWRFGAGSSLRSCSACSP
jgi:MFS-type transporter involved in bile tolerance (Atg22 family)